MDPIRSKALLLSCLAALVACSKTPARSDVQAVVSVKPAPVQSTAVPPKPSTYNVLLIMIDSLRADMPWTGYPRAIAPWLTLFEKRCTSYPRAYSLSSYTAKSVAPALAGQYPSAMPRDGYFFTKWLPENVLVSERAQQAKLRTLAGHAHGYFLPQLGLNQGFDDYRLLPGTFLDITGVANITSEALNGLAKQMLSDPKNTALDNGRRFFAYFHFLDPHYTYFKHEGHPDFGGKRRDLYDNEVHYTDRWVGDLVDWALARDWGKDTAVIITADHGEGFGERGQYRHAYELWESLVRVPLFIYLPGAKPRRIETARGHIDLAPTIAELLGLKVDRSLPGKSLVAEVFGAAAEPRPVVVDLPRSDLMDRRRAVVSGDYKLIAFGDDRTFMLFDVTKDPAEATDLSEQMPDQLERMKKLYFELSKTIPVVPVTGGVALKGAHPSQRF